MPNPYQDYINQYGDPNNGNPGTVYNQSPNTFGYGYSPDSQFGGVFMGGQNANLGRYHPPTLAGSGNDATQWNDNGGYAYNLPNAYGPFSNQVNYGQGSGVPGNPLPWAPNGPQSGQGPSWAPQFQGGPQNQQSVQNGLQRALQWMQSQGASQTTQQGTTTGTGWQDSINQLQAALANINSWNAPGNSRSAPNTLGPSTNWSNRSLAPNATGGNNNWVMPNFQQSPTKFSSAGHITDPAPQLDGPTYYSGNAAAAPTTPAPNANLAPDFLPQRNTLGPYGDRRRLNYVP